MAHESTGARVVIASPERHRIHCSASGPAAFPLSVAAVIYQPVRLGGLLELLHELLSQARALTGQAVAARNASEAAHGLRRRCLRHRPLGIAVRRPRRYPQRRLQHSETLWCVRQRLLFGIM